MNRSRDTEARWGGRVGGGRVVAGVLGSDVDGVAGACGASVVVGIRDDTEGGVHETETIAPDMAGYL